MAYLLVLFIPLGDGITIVSEEFATELECHLSGPEVLNQFNDGMDHGGHYDCVLNVRGKA